MSTWKEHVSQASYCVTCAAILSCSTACSLCDLLCIALLPEQQCRQAAAAVQLPVLTSGAI
jgi:hypothetical protein